MRRRPAPTLAAIVVAAALVLSACWQPSLPVSDPGPSTALTQLRGVGGLTPGIFDGHGRQVQLRGVNLNHLGDYFEADPRLPTVESLDADDWDDLAARGYNVVRLVTNWSAWEPQRDEFDDAYLARVRDAVAEANAHGIYVVIDMHQDAWSKFVFTPADEVCPDGTTHQKGWDGAPAWATFTDGFPTCTAGGREDSPAVKMAWANFWLNRDGIRDELVELWARIASEFADEAGVAGFDLLNEPGHADDLKLTTDGLTTFYVDTLAAIRDAERAAGAQPHLVFFEPTVFGAWPSDFTDDPDIVFAPHVYAEAISLTFPGALDFQMGLESVLSLFYGAPVWVGEYGAFGGDTAAWMSRFAKLHDGYRFAGGTWWQWEQECGDPHESPWPNTEDAVAAKLADCDDGRMPTGCTARSYPRATPGVLRSLTAAPCGGALTFAGSTPTRSTADLWIQPADWPHFDGNVVPDGPPPTITGDGVLGATVTAVQGGWRVFVTVEGDYAVTVAPPGT